MRVDLACGGTGGHIFPGLATAEALRARGHAVTLWLAGRDVEASATAGWDGPVRQAPAEGLPTRLSLRAVRALARLSGATRICLRAMGEDPPDVLVGMGSYATVSPALAARWLSVPLVLHEANVIPGRAVRLLAGMASAVAAAFEETRYHLRRRELVVTGMPLRAGMFGGVPAAPPGGTGPPVVLIMGGSSGAHRLNQVAVEAVIRAHGRGSAFRVVHLTGRDDEAWIRSAYAGAGVAADARAFRLDMGAVYRAATLAVCRAGASTCAELSAFGVPALLVPYPFAARNHQWANASALERRGAAHTIDEENLEPEWLAEYLTGSLQAPARLTRMRKAALQHASVEGASALAALVEKVARDER